MPNHNGLLPACNTALPQTVARLLRFSVLFNPDRRIINVDVFSVEKEELTGDGQFEPAATDVGLDTAGSVNDVFLHIEAAA